MAKFAYVHQETHESVKCYVVHVEDSAHPEMRVVHGDGDAGRFGTRRTAVQWARANGYIPWDVINKTAEIETPHSLYTFTYL